MCSKRSDLLGPYLEAGSVVLSCNCCPVKPPLARHGWDSASAQPSPALLTLGLPHGSSQHPPPPRAISAAFPVLLLPIALQFLLEVYGYFTIKGRSLLIIHFFYPPAFIFTVLLRAAGLQSS